MSKNFEFSLIWLLAGTAGCLLCLGFLSGAYIDGQYLPMGPDSFYHAHRALTAAGEWFGVIQFDPDMHVPEGSWVTWPWFYDWILSLVASVYLVAGGSDPMAALVYIPAIWIYINTALIILIAARLGLPLWARFLVALIYATSPLTVGLHGVGMLDHHYLEHCFILLALLTGHQWFQSMNSKRAALLFGGVLGLAHGIHNSMFVLQLPLLFALFILWSTGRLQGNARIAMFITGLLVMVMIMLLPSRPFQQGFFQFYTLSWFHLYVALCTAVCAGYMGYFPYSKRNLLLLFVTAAVLALPLLVHVRDGMSFIQAEMYSYDEITESVRLLDMLDSKIWTLASINAMYSMFIWLVPVLIILAIRDIYLHKKQSQQILYFLVFAVFGLVFMLFQFRFHYYGSFFIFLLIFHYFGKFGFDATRQRIFSVVIAIVVIVAYLPGIPYSMAERPLALDNDHNVFRPLYLLLGEICEQNPGVVLADTFEGHYISYYTECSVVSNNFLISPQHFAKARRVNYLFSLPPEQMIAEATEVDYVMVQLHGTDQVRNKFEPGDNRGVLLDASRTEYDGMFILVETQQDYTIGDQAVKIGRIFRLHK